MQDYRHIARKITLVLFTSQSLSSSAFISAFTVNALVGVDLTGQTAMAGVPGAIYVTGQGCGAMIWGIAMEKFGRRRSLAFGQMLGVTGSVVAATAVISRCFLLFLGGLVLVGMARSAVDLGRFVAAEVHLPAERGRAIANVLLGSTVGAVLGPLLVGPLGRLALAAGLPELAGAYGIGFAVLFLAALIIFLGLRPEPRDIARELAHFTEESPRPEAAHALGKILHRPGVIVAMVSLIFAQLVMVVPMSITSVHMKMHNHPLTSLSLVISVHTLGMFAFSLISGKLTDRWGRGPVIALGSFAMMISCFMAAPSVSLLPLMCALFLLGLGWNFAYVAGSTLLADQLFPQERAKTQGINDLLLNLASGGGQVISGVMFAAGGYGLMSLAAAAAAAVPLVLTVWWERSRRNCLGLTSADTK